MKIMIKKNYLKMPPGNGKKLLYIIIWYLFAWMLVGFFKFPKSIVYFGDVLNLYVFLCAVYYAKKNHTAVEKDGPLLFMVLFTMIGLISSLVNFESPLLVAWGVRNNVRFFVFYYSCLVFLNKEDIWYMFRLLGVLFWISLPLCIYQRYFISYSSTDIIGDYIGGIYHGFQGVTTPFNVLLTIYTAYIMRKFFDNKCKWTLFLITMLSALYMSALSELKVFIVEIVIIALMTMLQKRISWKSVILSLMGFAALGITINFFVHVNSNGRLYYTKDIFSLTGMLEIISRSAGYDGVGDLNRLTGIMTLLNMVFKRDFFGALLGLGIGNADYANYSFLTSDFYNRYSTLHYQWFSTTFVFVETGFAGLIAYMSIFIAAFVQGIRDLEKKTFISGFYSIMIVIIMLLFIYNPSLRSEQCGYILYFFLAIPGAYRKQRRVDHDT